jgi:hypothetical protein
MTFVSVSRAFRQTSCSHQCCHDVDPVALQVLLELASVLGGGNAHHPVPVIQRLGHAQADFRNQQTVVVRHA